MRVGLLILLFRIFRNERILPLRRGPAVAGDGLTVQCERRLARRQAAEELSVAVLAPYLDEDRALRAVADLLALAQTCERDLDCSVALLLIRNVDRKDIFLARIGACGDGKGVFARASILVDQKRHAARLRERQRSAAAGLIAGNAPDLKIRCVVAAGERHGIRKRRVLKLVAVDGLRRPGLAVLARHALRRAVRQRIAQLEPHIAAVAQQNGVFQRLRASVLGLILRLHAEGVFSGRCAVRDAQLQASVGDGKALLRAALLGAGRGDDRSIFRVLAAQRKAVAQLAAAQLRAPDRDGRARVRFARDALPLRHVLRPRKFQPDIRRLMPGDAEGEGMYLQCAAVFHLGAQGKRIDRVASVVVRLHEKRAALRKLAALAVRRAVAERDDARVRRALAVQQKAEFQLIFRELARAERLARLRVRQARQSRRAAACRLPLHPRLKVKSV